MNPPKNIYKVFNACQALDQAWDTKISIGADLGLEKNV